MKETKRNTSIDILRILAMVMIIMWHFLLYRENGLLQAANGQLVISNGYDCIPIILMGVVIIGTNIFFLISGYFGIRFRISKFIELIIITYF